jgi:hypothetical protein
LKQTNNDICLPATHELHTNCTIYVNPKTILKRTSADPISSQWLQGVPWRFHLNFILRYWSPRYHHVTPSQRAWPSIHFLSRISPLLSLVQCHSPS